jgi:hypothetical protein
MSRGIFWRIGFAAFWAAAMLAVGLTTYNALGNRKSHTRTPVVTAPHTTVPVFHLPGTVYLAHHGGLYRMQDGLFTELQKQTTWSQPAIAPDGSRLVAVQRTELNYSDLYLLDPGSGQVTSQLTSNKNKFVVLLPALLGRRRFDLLQQRPRQDQLQQLPGGPGHLADVGAAASEQAHPVD